MKETAPPKISIVGPGAVGMALARRFADERVLRIDHVVARTESGAEAAVGILGQGRPVALAELAALPESNLVLLSVPDDALDACAQAFGRIALKREAIIFHCSGARPSALLDGLAAAQSLRAACAHPIAAFGRGQTFVIDADPPFCCIEGEPTAMAELADLFGRIGFQTLDIRAVERPLYHAAIVMMANYLVTLIDAGLGLYESAGIDSATARQLAKPILTSVLEKALTEGPEAALAGPIVRGDSGVVEAHLRALQATTPELVPLYVELARRTVVLAERKSGGELQARKAIERALEAQHARW